MNSVKYTTRDTGNQPLQLGFSTYRGYSENLIHKPRHCQTVIGYLHDDDIKKLLYYLNWSMLLRFKKL